MLKIFFDKDLLLSSENIGKKIFSLKIKLRVEPLTLFLGNIRQETMGKFFYYESGAFPFDDTLKYHVWLYFLLTIVANTLKD